VKYYSIALLLFVFLFISCDEDQSIQDLEPAETDLRVFGGTNSQEGAYPFVVSIQRQSYGRSSHHCGGTIIDKNWILTAAHCVADKSGNIMTTFNFSIVVGTTKPGSSGTRVKPSKIYVHHDYHPLYIKNDIALIKLESPVNYPRITLSTTDSDIDDYARVIGWGKWNYGNISSTLREADLPIISTYECSSKYDKLKNYMITDKQICALDTSREKDACHGDSGGPLLTRSGNSWKQIGIVSFGKACVSGYPGVYTKVSEYLNWIQSITRTTINNNSGNNDDVDEEKLIEKKVSGKGSVQSKEWKRYNPIKVEKGAFKISITGDGDADLYIKKGSAPSFDNYDCRPYKDGSNEQCNLQGPGTFYIGIYGYKASSFNIQGSWFVYE